jgi:hypothetical protein
MATNMRRLSCVLPVVLFVLSAPLAQAGDVSNVIFRIDATNAGGSGFLEFTADQLVYNPGTNRWGWNTGLVEIENGSGDTIAILDQANVQYVKDPVADSYYYIQLGFALHAGSSDTNISIQSALLSFPMIPPAALQPPVGGARATASFGATDLNGNGVTLLGDGPVGAGAFKAYYNGNVMFADLVNLVSGGPGGSGNASQTMPMTGYAAIPVGVQDMSMLIAFDLTYADSANGTLTYRLLPEPVSGLGLLLVSAVALGLRRR